MVNPYIALKIGEILVRQAKKEISLQSHVEEDLKWIQTEMSYIQSYLKDAEAKQVRTEVESTFIRDIWDFAYAVEDILDTYFPKLRLGGSLWKKLLDLRNMRINHVFAKKVKRIRRRAEDLKSRRATYVIDERNNINEQDTLNPRKVYRHPVVGFDNLINTLVHKVRDEEYSHHLVLFIIGSAGLGKTTLAKKVYNSVRESNSNEPHFNCAAWICVSQRPNKRKLLQQLAQKVGLDKEKIDDDVADNLSEFLRTKRYVIVIDDIWHNEAWDAWDALKIGLPMDSENGSRIILTSRNSNIVEKVGGLNYVHFMKPLNHKNSGELLEKLIVNDQQDICETKVHPQLEKNREQILEKCRGVPLAIVLVAGLLKERPESEWNELLEGMGRDNDEREIFALSYKDLPLNLKPCFLYFGIFPEDHEVEAFDLINLWAAEGFIRGNRRREVEEVGDDYLNHLIARNLIQVVEYWRYNGRVRSVQIHDIMHRICIQEAEDINFFNICNNDENFNSTVKVHRVTGNGKDVDHHPAWHPNASSFRGVFCFTCQNPWNIVDHENSKYLRVLHDAGARDGIIPRPVLTNICNLRLLTYLKLTSFLWPVELPYAISNLKNLLTLDLQDCLDLDVPNVIWSMQQLRHILLPKRRSTGCVPSNSCLSSCRVNLDVFHSHPVEISLPNLQTLRWVHGNFFDANWLIKLTSLRRLGFNLIDDKINRALSDWEPGCHKLEELSLDGYSLPYYITISLNLSRYDNLSTLHLCLELNELLHDKLPPNLIELTLQGTKLRTNPMEALKKLEKLKCLRLQRGSYWGMELVCSGETGDFPQLEELEIGDKFDMLLIEKDEGMPSLRKFTCSRCIKETRVPDRVRAVMSII